jgi:hypothetical protein
MSKVFEAFTETTISCCRIGKNRCNVCLTCKGLNEPFTSTYQDPDFSTWRKDGGFEYSYRTGL